MGKLYSYGKLIKDLDISDDRKGCFVIYASNNKKVWVPFHAISWLSDEY